MERRGKNIINDNDVTADDTIGLVMKILFYIYTNESSKLSKLCSKKIVWKTNDALIVGNECDIIEKVKKRILPFKSIYLKIFEVPNYFFSTNDHKTIVSNNFIVKNGKEKKRYTYTFIFVNQVLEYAELNQFGSSIEYKIQSVSNEIYMVDENDIYYVEAFRDHMLWHVKGSVLESINTLKEIEKMVSKNFIRIHRSFIVNRAHIVSVQRCFVTLKDGEKLPIPYKRYVQIKNNILAV